MKKTLHALFCSLLLCVSGCHVADKKETDISEKHDWTVTSDPKKEKAQNEYDVIVVGAGIGGLTTGSVLAKSGYKVLVLEQQSQVGGYCTSYSRNGFTFPVGAHDISGCDQGAIRMLLDILNLKKEDLFALHTRTYIFGEKKISFTGTHNDVEQKLSELFPAEKQSLTAFFHEARTAFEENRASRRNPQAPCPTYEKWQKTSYQQKLDEFFHDEELKKFFYSILGYIGTKPNETVASYALDGVLSYFIYGGYYPKNGGKLFADSLKDVIESHGGTVLTHTKVDKILVTSNHVTGVRSGGAQFLSPLVVANANAKTVLTQLIPPGTIDKSFISALQNLKMSCSVAKVNLGVDLDLSSFSSIVMVFPQSKEGSPPAKKGSFFIGSNADKQAAPEGCSSISIGVSSKYSDVPPSGTPEYKEYKEKCAQVAIAKLETVIPGIREHIVVKDVITPRTFESFTSMPEGAVYAFDQSRNAKRPYFKTPVEGLYLASASTLPGGGVEAVAAAGLICAKDILANEKTQKSSAPTVLLSPPLLKSSLSVEEAINERHSTRHFEALSIPLSDIAQLLWAAAGITHGQSLRAAPSAGALYPLEIYLVAENITDLPAGIYKYIPQKHALEKRLDGHLSKELCQAAHSQASVGQAAASIVICAWYDREAKKYGKDSTTYADIEGGCVAENIGLQAVSCGIGTVIVGGFDMKAVKDILGSPPDEKPLCILPLGKVL